MIQPKSFRLIGFLLAILALQSPAAPVESSGVVTLVEKGKALLPILQGSCPGPAQELLFYLNRMSGADFQILQVPRQAEIGVVVVGAGAIHVGLAEDFPWRDFENVERLGEDGFIIESDGKSLFLVGNGSAGVQHAVTTFLQQQGCRWFFPGKVWEVVPKKDLIQGKWKERQVPSFPDYRVLWYGYGPFDARQRTELADWHTNNRCGSGGLEVNTGHQGNIPKTESS